MTIRRGEIYFVELMPTKEREQAGYRPVLVVSADAINRQPLVVTLPSIYIGGVISRRTGSLQRFLRHFQRGL